MKVELGMIRDLTSEYHCPVCKRSVVVSFPYSGMNFNAMLRMLSDRECPCGRPYKVKHAQYETT